MRRIKDLFAVILAVSIFLWNSIGVFALEVSAPSVVLMEASTGKVIYEKDAYTKRSPASVTKVMTLLLIFEELDKGSIRLEDLVTTSAYAKSMGGSQVYLEEGEEKKDEMSLILQCLEKKMLIDISYDPLPGADMSAYKGYPVHGSIALTARGLQVLELAKARGIRTILVTRFRKSPAAKLADVVLLCGSNEGPFQFGSVPAKVAQLIVMDILFQEYTHRNKESCEENLRRIGDALSGKHI